MLIEGIRGLGSTYQPAVTQTSGASDGSRVPEAPVAQRASLPYLSPVLQYDNDAAIAILMFRDGNNGDVEQQYPSKQVVREYQLRGREMAMPASTRDEGGQGEPQGNSLLSSARADVAAIAGAARGVPLPPSGGAGVGSMPVVAASPTVAIAGGGTAGSAVNFVA
ncbi:hypothetical protein [Niveispirillum fermenti]|uniref:hypothetical protein n=1 Tax=Niveispirillum fermenti TaxID=1233113 RepID=UPI003A8A0C3D